MTDTRTGSQPAQAVLDDEHEARRAFDAVHRDPAAAASVLRRLVDDPNTSPRARMYALWGLGRVLHDAGDVAATSSLFESAINASRLAGGYPEEPHIRLSWATSLQTAGEHTAALAQLDLAEPAVDESLLGRVLTQRGSIHMLLGDSELAIAQYDAAVVLLRTAGDRLGETRLLCNRGIALTRLGRTAAAKADLELARRLSEEDGQHLLVATALHNLGFLEMRLGRWPQALAQLAQARERYHKLGSPGRFLAALDADECELLLLAGFPAEARDVAEAVLADANSSGDVLQLAESHLLLARALNLLGEMDEAATTAATAAELFRRTGRTAWSALAEYVGAMSDAESDGGSALGRLDRAAATLEGLGWAGEAAEVRVRMARIALHNGQRDLARDVLAATAASRRHGSARLRAEAWHATALLQTIDGGRTAARRAIDAGLRVVDRHRATLGASDLRVRASADGVELAALGVRLALEGGKAADVFVAAERWRAGALAERAAPLVGDDPADHDLAELRRLERELREVDVGAGADAAAEFDAAHKELLRLEHRITAITRLAPGDPRALGSRFDVRRLRAELGDSTLVEFVDVDGRLYATVVTRSRTRLVALAPREQVLGLVGHLAFEIRRLSAFPPGHDRAAAAIASYRRTAGELDSLIVGPLRLGAGPVIVVPTGPLHSLPWSALPGLQRAAGLTIAPSAAWWMSGTSDRPAGDGVLLVHGPDLPHAAAELDAIATVLDGVTELAGQAATAGAVLAAMTTAGLVHIAAHGSFRADNPMFSSLRLADGPLYVYDLQRLASSPHTVVLTACNAGRSGVYGGDELLGTGVALLSLGVRSVIAPLLPVRDESTAPFAVDIHRALVDGLTPAEALARATATALAGDDPGRLAAAASFQCLGRQVPAGAVRRPPREA